MRWDGWRKNRRSQGWDGESGVGLVGVVVLLVFLLLFGNAKFDGEGFVAVVIGAVVGTFAVTSLLFGHGEKRGEVIFGHFNAHFFKAFLLCFLDVLSPRVQFLHRLDAKRFCTFGDFLRGLDAKQFFVTDDACLGEVVDGAAECLEGGMESADS